jgi:hypothetical protein
MTTIYLTPSQDHLAALAKDHPELHHDIQHRVLDALAASGAKVVARRIEQRAQKALEKLYDEAERAYFVSNAYGNPTFSKAYEAKFKARIEDLLSTQMEALVQETLDSPSFKRDVASQVQRALKSKVMALLDADIEREAKAMLA